LQQLGVAFALDDIPEAVCSSFRRILKALSVDVLRSTGLFIANIAA